MKQITDEGIPNKDLGFIVQQGFIMVLVAIVSLSAGVLGAKFASIAGTGVAAELRSAEMKKIQAFSFKNIDHFSNASLITRMTSDVNNIQKYSHYDDAYFNACANDVYLRDFLCGKY